MKVITRNRHFIPRREDSYERLVQDENCQFSDTTVSVEDEILRMETIRHLLRALAQLEAAEIELIQAYYYQELTERECAAAAGIMAPPPCGCVNRRLRTSSPPLWARYAVSFIRIS